MSEIILALALPNIPTMDANHVIHVNDTTPPIEVEIPHWPDFTEKDEATLHFGSITCPKFTVHNLTDPIKIYVPASGLIGDYHIYYDVLQPASGNTDTSPHLIVHIENTGTIKPDPAVRLQPIPYVFFENRRVGLDCDIPTINFAMVDSPSLLHVEIHFNQKAGKVSAGDNIEIKMIASAYEPFSNTPKTRLIKTPSPYLTDKDITQGFYAFDLEKKELLGFDADLSNKKGTVWMTAAFKNSITPSNSCVWWCDIDTVPPGNQ